MLGPSGGRRKGKMGRTGKGIATTEPGRVVHKVSRKKTQLRGTGLRPRAKLPVPKKERIATERRAATGANIGKPEQGLTI